MFRWEKEFFRQTTYPIFLSSVRNCTTKQWPDKSQINIRETHVAISISYLMTTLTIWLHLLILQFIFKKNSAMRNDIASYTKKKEKFINLIILESNIFNNCRLLFSKSMHRFLLKCTVYILHLLLSNIKIINS